MRSFAEMLDDSKAEKSIILFMDIETFQYNQAAGRNHPSDFKNMTFSVAVSWMNMVDVEFEVFPNFKQFFDTILNAYSNRKKNPKIFLNFHNGNKYDNHFMRFDLIYYYHTKVENFYLQTATTEDSNENALRIKDLSNRDKQGIILEKRIKSEINLEMTFFLEGIQFQTMDNWVKTNSSIKMLGKKLKTLGVVSDDELKTDFDYLQYNVDEDMSDEASKHYAEWIFNQLTEDELTYIRNDVILLAKSVYYYSDLFNGFDYSKMTFTSNILNAYNDNDLTSFQLLNRIGEGKEKIEVRYTDYQFANQNFYDWLKPFYRGGLNFYNQHFLGKIVQDVFSMDINSSYPFAMHHFKIPTFIKSYEEFEHETKVPIVINDDEYSLYQISKETFDILILDKIESVILKQMFVKYYATNEFININSYTFRMIANITGLTFSEIPVYAYVTFETMYFGSRQQISDFYFIKTQGKNKYQINYESPYNITITDNLNTGQFTQEEIDHSKVNLNGLYGIPALRPYFNLFRKDNAGNYFNVENGHKNAERNIVFSIFVTSVSLWNLLDPLKFLTQTEIDENFLYCDTDSLYLKRDVFAKIPQNYLHAYNLGKWDLEHEHIQQFYVLNHKKYAYVDEENTIQIRSGGIANESFDTNMDFETFIETQFSDGVEIDNLKSIYNAQGTISIYQSKTKLEVGKGYRINASGKMYQQLKEKLMQQVRQAEKEFVNDVLYIESPIGTFSLSDFYPYTHEVKQKRPLVYLEIKQEKIRDLIVK